MIDLNLIDALCGIEDGTHTLVLIKNGDNVTTKSDGSPLAMLFYLVMHCLENLDEFSRDHMENIYDTAEDLQKIVGGEE